jgi:transcription antitermination factor NusG
MWLVVYSEAAGEKLARDNLEDKGHEVFLPLERYRNRAKQVRERALFSRYLFLAVPESFTYFSSIRGTRGVRDILSQDGRPRAVPTIAIERLRKAEGAGLFDQTPEKRLKVGSEVRVDGPLYDLVGRIKSAKHPARIEILFTIFGTDRVVTAPLSKIELV